MRSNESTLAPSSYGTSPWHLGLYAVLFSFSVAVIGVTSYVPGQEDLLLNLTIENSFYELASVLLLAMLSIYCFSKLMRSRSEGHVFSLVKVLWIIIGTLAFLAAGEELSWGQHLFGFSSGEFFQEHNLQAETNLHNFVPGHLFAGTLNTTIYIAFIFAPTVVWLFPRLLASFGKLTPLAKLLLPSPHISLIMCFSGTFHPYFLPTSTVSTSALLMALACLGLLLWRVENFRQTSCFLHWLAIIAAMVFFMLNTHVFSFYNMQAEVREMFVILAGTFWVMEWSNKARQGSLN